MNQYTYKWHNYSMLIGCTKCGDKIIFQAPDKKVECKSCGNVEGFEWKKALELVKIDEIRKKDTGSKQLMGSMDVKSSYSPTPNISCYHCNKNLDIAPDSDLKNFHCNHCHKKLDFVELSNELVFYSFKKAEIENTNPTMIAVRCISCAAPLEADPTKANYHCKFCGTENILPPSMRFKVVVNDVFIGVKNRFYPKELAFNGSSEEVIKSLKQNGVKSFTEEELSIVAKKHLSNPKIYFEITANSGTVSKEVEEEIFKISLHQQQIKLIGHKLGKSPTEIQERLSPLQVNTAQNSSPSNKEKKPGFFKRLFG